MTGGLFSKSAKPSSHHAPRKRGWSGLGALFMLVTVAALVAWAPEVGAYDQYTQNGGDATNCGTCHGDFRANGYVSLKDGTAWNDDMHDGHRRVMLDGDCDTCHSPGGRSPVILNSSNGGAGFPAIACVGCHGREGDVGTDTGLPDPTPGDGNPWFPITDRGAGLRQQHWIADRIVNGTSTRVCADCHADATPANYTTVAEDVPPPYYFTPDPNHPFKPNDACDANGTESVFGTLGLDNDGNGLIDSADVACAPVNLPPVAVDDAYTTNEETPLNVAAPGVLTNDSDPESDPITAVPDTGPSSGALTLNADGSFTYTPNAGFNGTDSFTYFANDGTSDSTTPATVTITVNAVNDAPVAVGDSYTTD
ncbi:MAG: cadherin-like domain-containing protein, partial [Rhodospirillales bacterium]|nr:cadherin-like domain-containing protein [Rhodospirillales bacterium]